MRRIVRRVILHGTVLPPTPFRVPSCRMRRDAAQDQLLEMHGIGSTKERPGIVHTPDVIEQNDGGEGRIGHRFRIA
jgi:hypothetical protein